MPTLAAAAAAAACADCRFFFFLMARRRHIAAIDTLRDASAAAVELMLMPCLLPHSSHAADFTRRYFDCHR